MLKAARVVARWAALSLASLTLTGPASAQAPDPPETLPPSSNSPGRVPQDFEACPDGSSRCADATVAEMYRRWRPLNNRCDHKAVFALTYLRTTEEFVRTVRSEPGFFSDQRWVNWEDAVFAELYFRAFDAWVGGRPVPGAWRVAFEATESDDVTGPGDLLLGMSAHIQRDLPFTLAHVGLVKPDGQSRKPDHDRVNRFLDRVVDPLQEELARRYDPLFADTDAGPSPFDEAAALQAVRGFRETAWRNAERLVNARSPEEREAVARSIEEYSESQGRSILAANTYPGYGPVRDAHCRSSNTQEPEGAPVPPPGQGGRGSRRGRARISLPSGCARRPFRVTVTGREIATVDFSIDGRRMASVRRADRRGRYEVTVDPRRLSRGRHRVAAKVAFTRMSNTRPLILRRTFRRCLRSRGPRFAG